MIPQQQVRPRERRGILRNLPRNGILNGPVSGAVILLRPPEADTFEHAQAVRFERQPGAHPAEHEDFLSPRLPNVRELMQGPLSFVIWQFENRVEIAGKLRDGYASDFPPSKDARFGPHATQLSQRQEHCLIGLPDGLRVHADLLPQALEDGRAPFVGEQIAGVLPHHQLKRSAGRRQRRFAISLLQFGDKLLELQHGSPDYTRRAAQAGLSPGGQAKAYPTWDMLQLVQASEARPSPRRCAVYSSLRAASKPMSFFSKKFIDVIN